MKDLSKALISMLLLLMWISVVVQNLYIHGNGRAILRWDKMSIFPVYDNSSNPPG